MLPLDNHLSGQNEDIISFERKMTEYLYYCKITTLWWIIYHQIAGSCM